MGLRVWQKRCTRSLCRCYTRPLFCWLCYKMYTWYKISTVLWLSTMQQLAGRSNCQVCNLFVKLLHFIYWIYLLFPPQFSIFSLNSSHNGFDVRQGSLKKAIDLRDTCNGFSSRNPLFDPRNANNWIKNKNGELYSSLIVLVNHYYSNS